MRTYGKASLIEETFDLAGEDILANYDRPLYKRYHIFLMDPREEAYLVSDGKHRMEESFAAAGLMTGIECEIRMNSSQKALDDDGKSVLKQIKEWETVEGVRKISDSLNQLLKSTEKKEQLVDTVLNAQTDVSESSVGGTSSDSGESEQAIHDSKSQTESQSLPDTVETEEEKRVKNTWKEWKMMLYSIFDSGILLYAVEDKSTISSLQLSSTSELPSKNRLSDRISFSLDQMNLTGISKLQDLCKEGVSVDWNSSLLTTDVYLIPYIFDCFSQYRKPIDEKSRCLSYEIEYLIGGKKSDKANLKYVADQIFLLRFLTNYAYALKDTAITSEAEAMATILTGILGFPAGLEAVKLLLVASLCYGESLLEVRAIFSGKKVAIVKTRENWNLSFATAIAKLGSHADIIPVTNGVGYDQFLASLLVIRSGSRKVLYRMMDIMQCNVMLEEPQFRMKDCISAFDWSGDFSWTPMVRKIIAFGIRQDQKYSITIRRTPGYE